MKKQPDQSSICVNIPTDTYRELQRIAKEQDRSLAATVRRALRFYLETSDDNT